MKRSIYHSPQLKHDILINKYSKIYNSTNFDKIMGM